MRLPFLTFDVPELSNLCPEDAHAILDRAKFDPRVVAAERFRVWGVRGMIALLLSAVGFYFLAKNAISPSVLTIVLVMVFALAFAGFVIVLVSYKFRMTFVLRQLVRQAMADATLFTPAARDGQ